jgi:hypothetical protein
MKPIPNFNMWGACNNSGTLFNCDTIHNVVVITDDHEIMGRGATVILNQNKIRDGFLKTMQGAVLNNPTNDPLGGNVLKVHAIRGIAGSSCSISRPGLIYDQLAAATGGLLADICQNDWDPIFNELKDNILASGRPTNLSCTGRDRTMKSVRLEWQPGVGVNLTAAQYTYSKPANSSAPASIYVSFDVLDQLGVPYKVPGTVIKSIVSYTTL